MHFFEEEKLEAARKVQEHITHAQAERKVFNDCVKRSKDRYYSQDKMYAFLIIRGKWAPCTLDTLKSPYIWCPLRWRTKSTALSYKRK